MDETTKILLKQFHPERYEEEQKAKEKHLEETLAFVEGIKAALALQEEEKAKEAEIKKSNILFKTDPLHPRGWSKN